MKNKETVSVEHIYDIEIMQKNYPQTVTEMTDCSLLCL